MTGRTQKELEKMLEFSLLQPHECPGCEKVYLREDMTPYLGKQFAEKGTLLCLKCNSAAEAMYAKKE